MRHFDFAPLYRSTIGFDRMAQLLDSIGGADEATYPPYNIERLSENEYRITMAVAGFGEGDLKIEVKENALTVRGDLSAKDKASEEQPRQYLHRGIASRAFERRFQLADHVEVKGADLKDGLLHIDLVRNIPERMKARVIPVGVKSANAAVDATTTPKQIEASN
ncbi:MAG: Hsp20 family protein [Hyphomicrobiaceae bacterium]